MHYRNESMLKINFDIFCYVIDNFGDIGVSLRLGRDLKQKGHNVRFFCSNLKSLQQIKNQNDNLQFLSFDELKYYDSKNTNVLINAFSYKFSNEIARNLKKNKVLVINLEYLSAEKWVESCHQLPSPYLGLNCYFFFPGFTNKTGGLTVEDCFLHKIKNKKQIKKNNRQITLFSYENKNIKKIINLLKNSKKDNEILVFEGKALDNINNIYAQKLKIGDTLQLFQNVKLRIIPMVTQDQYDNLLIESDLNLVRGEDSIVRAMLCGKPFLWQIYTQDEDAHIIKLNNLFDRFLEFFPDDALIIEKIRNLSLIYNDKKPCNFEITSYDEIDDEFSQFVIRLQNYLISLDSLTNNLLKFINTKLP